MNKKEEIIIELMELEELIRMSKDKKEIKKYKTQFTKLNNKLKEMEI